LPAALGSGQSASGITFAIDRARLDAAQQVGSLLDSWVEAGGDSLDFGAKSFGQGGGQPLGVNGFRRTVGLASLVEVDGSVQGGPGRPGDHRDVAGAAIGKAGRARCCLFKDVSSLAVDTAAQVPAAAFDAHTDDVEDLAPSDVAEVESGSDLTKPRLAGRAHLGDRAVELTAGGRAGEAIGIDGEQPGSAARELLPQLAHCWIEIPWLAVAVEVPRRSAVEAEGPLDLVRPSVLEPAELVARERARGSAVAETAAQVDMRHGPRATADRRLESHEVHALRARHLAGERRTRGLLDAGLDRAGIERRETVGQRWLDAQDQAREVPGLGPERILSE
jgi:hypothetical protein